MARAENHTDPFLDSPSETTAYCPTRGYICSARNACLKRFFAAKTLLEPERPSRLRHLYNGAVSSLGRSFMLITPIGGAEVESLSTAVRNEEIARAKQEAITTRDLLERNCNEVCIMEDIHQSYDYASRLPEANAAIEELA